MATDVPTAIHNYHNGCPPQEFFLFMAIAMAEAPTPNLLAILAIEIPISRLKKQAISALAFDTLLLWLPDLISFSLTPDSLHIRPMISPIDSVLLFRICRAIVSSASRITPCTNSPFPKILLS